MPLTLSLTPGYTFAIGEQVDESNLNALGNPIIDVQGELDQIQITPGTVNKTNLASDAYFFGNASLSGNLITFNANGQPSVTPSGYVAGQSFCFLASFNCPAGGVQVNVSGIGTQNLYKNVNQTVGQGDFISGQLVAIQYDGTNFQLLGGGATAGGATEGLSSNVVGSGATFSATRLIFKAVGGGSFGVNGVSGIAVSAGNPVGAGGMDIGSLALSTWYYIYAIWNGSTVSGVISASATVPTLPAGYVAYALICPVYTYNVGGGVAAFAQQYSIGRKVFTVAQTAFSAGVTAVNTLQAVSLSAIVPPMATAVSGSYGPNAGTGAFAIKLCATTAAHSPLVFAGNTTPSTILYSFLLSAPYTMPMITAQTLYVEATMSSSLLINVIGFEW